MKSKKLFLSAIAAFLLCGCAVTTPAPATKPAVAAKPAKPAAKAKFSFPALSNPQSWTMVIVPDTQTYIKQIENQGILDMMLAWIVRRRAELNIRQVLFTGDLVYSNDRGDIDQIAGVQMLSSLFMILPFMNQ